MEKFFWLQILVLSLLFPNFADATAANAPPSLKPLGPYSQAITVGNTTYISGQIPLDPQTNQLVSGDFKYQFQQALTNLVAVAQSAGGSLDDIVKVVIYVADLNNFAIINQVMTEQFHQPYPARVVIEVKALPKQANVEIEAIMVNHKK